MGRSDERQLPVRSDCVRGRPVGHTDPPLPLRDLPEGPLGAFRPHGGRLPGALPLGQREEKLSSYESSPGKLRRFCSVCGSHLVADRKGQLHVVLRVATLDEAPDARPRAHIWVSHDILWLEYGENVPSYPSMPPPETIDRRYFR